MEFLLCLPLLILLTFPLVDIARIIQANIILTNMAREGANLMTRSTRQAPEILQAIAATAPPLDMPARGALRITKIMAVRYNGALKNIVTDQWHWTGGSYKPTKGIWTCGSWDSDGKCPPPPPRSTAPALPVMAGQLAEDDVIVVVEAFYNFPLIFERMNLGGGIATPSLSPDLYSMAIFDYHGGAQATPEPVSAPPWSGGGGGGWYGGGGWSGPSYENFWE